MKLFLQLLLFLLFSATAQASPDLAEADRLIKAGKFAEAYDLLSPAEFDLAGNAEYDYLLGIAALETERSDRATLIFERVLAVNSAHTAARLELARAYFAFGDYDRAQREFVEVRQQNPPPRVLVAIERYLTALDVRRRPPSATRAAGYIEAGFGIDSNASGGPRQSSIYFPAYGSTFLLDPQTRQLHDNYSQLGLGGGVSDSLNANVAFYAGADVKVRDYNRYGGYDYGSSDLRAGVQFAEEKNAYRLNVGYNDYRLASLAYRKMHSLGLDWRRNLDAGVQVSAFSQYAELHYVQPSMQSNDINQAMLGGGLTLQPWGADAGVLLFSAFLGQEREVTARVDGNKLFAGGRIGAQKTYAGNVDVLASLGFQFGRYAREDTYFLAMREDKLHDAMLGAVWRFAPLWSVRPQLTWMRNDSNFSLYNYERYDLGVFLRRDFQ